MQLLKQIRFLSASQLVISSAILLMIFSAPLTLFGASPAEEDHFAYIVELYYASEGYYDEALREIDTFINQYPESGYLSLTSYIRANIALRQAKYQKADSIYTSLIGQNLPPDILADVYFNYALCSYYQERYDLSLELLGVLEKDFDLAYYTHQAHIWKGRIFAAQGYLLSAKREFEQLGSDVPIEARYDYFVVLLSLDEHDIAKSVFDNIDKLSAEYPKYRNAWLAYLLSQGDYPGFDDAVAGIDPGEIFTDPELGLLVVRKQIDTGMFDNAEAFLDSLEHLGDWGVYYRGVIFKERGQAAVADTLFRSLSRSQEEGLALYAYLERIKILYSSDPESAIDQLETYLSDASHSIAEVYHVLGTLYYQQSEYIEAIKQFSNAADYQLKPNLADRNEFYLAESLQKTGDSTLAQEVYNRYLNRYPLGKYRDIAYCQLGLIAYQQKDWDASRTFFQRLIQEHPDSSWADAGLFHLGELFFQESDFAQAESYYQAILPTHQNKSVLNLRLAQTAYYQNKLAAAETYLTQIDPTELGFEISILKAAIRFSARDFAGSLVLYRQADSLAVSESQKLEAKSYQAYVMLYLQRYDEASDLYLELGGDNNSADVFLYQAAMAASRGGNWQRALTLYDRFVDQFPDSAYLQAVLADIATALFNLGRYEDAFRDWTNILRRFTANTFVTEDELSYLGEVFTGLELSCRRLGGEECITELSELIDAFASEYIKYELEFIVVKLYAGAELWEDVLREASALRASLNLPEPNRNKLELLMAQSFINLDQYAEADTILTELNQMAGSAESLIQWGDLAALTGNPEYALERYRAAFSLQPDAFVWLKMIEASKLSGYLGFNEIWELGSGLDEPLAWADRLNYLFDQGSYDLAAAEADSLLEVNADRRLRGEAELLKGKIEYQRQSYQDALNTMRKVRLLYREITELYSRATFEYIRCLIALGAMQEASLTFDQDRALWDEDQLFELESLLSGSR